MKLKAVNVIARLAAYIGNADTDATEQKAIANELLNLAAMIDPTRRASRPSACFRLAAPDEVIIKLLDELKRAKYVAEDTAPDAFIYACTARSNTTADLGKIQWLGANNTLGYFVNRFFGHTDGQVYKTALQCFSAWGQRQPTTKALADGCSKVFGADHGTTASARQFFDDLHKRFKQWVMNPQSLADELADLGHCPIRNQFRQALLPHLADDEDAATDFGHLAPSDYLKKIFTEIAEIKAILE